MRIVPIRPRQLMIGRRSRMTTVWVVEQRLDAPAELRRLFSREL
jgi:hypothetical protein